jgi:hypothetical protein
MDCNEMRLKIVLNNRSGKHIVLQLGRAQKNTRSLDSWLMERMDKLGWRGLFSAQYHQLEQSKSGTGEIA